MRVQTHITKVRESGRAPERIRTFGGGDYMVSYWSNGDQMRKTTPLMSYWHAMNKSNIEMARQVCTLATKASQSDIDDAVKQAAAKFATQHALARAALMSLGIMIDE